MSTKKLIKKNAAGDWASMRRRTAAAIMFGATSLVVAACGGSEDGAATVEAINSESTADVAPLSESTSDETTDQAQESLQETGDGGSETGATERNDDAAGDDHGDESDADDHTDELDNDSDDHADDQPKDDRDDAHAADDPGELITAASDGTPEISTVAEPGEAVPEGSYVLNILGEEWRLGVDKPLLLGTSESGFFAFTTEELAGSKTLLALLKTVGIIAPREVGVHQEHDPILPEATVDIPDDLTSWFDAVPQVTVVDSGSATVAGESAVWFRLTVDPAAGATFQCPFSDQCAGFVVMPTGVTVLAQEIDVTVWKLDAIPDVMPWLQVEDPANFEAARQAMIELLDSLSAA